VFLSFPPGVKDHNGRMEIQLRIVSAPGRKIKLAAPRTLVRFFGGQGTTNVNSRSPDSRQFAYVVYQPLP
jgi:hypothetical protein